MKQTNCFYCSKNIYLDSYYFRTKIYKFATTTKGNALLIYTSQNIYIQNDMK